MSTESLIMGFVALVLSAALWSAWSVFCRMKHKASEEVRKAQNAVDIIQEKKAEHDKGQKVLEHAANNYSDAEVNLLLNYYDHPSDAPTAPPP